MYSIETKKIDNKTYLYAVRRIRIGKKYKKISVYIGKAVPKTKTQEKKILDALQTKELQLVPAIVQHSKLPDTRITTGEYKKLEEARVRHKYLYAALSGSKQAQWWRHFAIRFTFESNAIEGSKLSEREVAAITLGRTVKKTTPRAEVQEVENTIKAIDWIRDDSFTINERTILRLHAVVTKDLSIPQGFKKRSIVINNKTTTPPGQVRAELAKLLKWWKAEKTVAPFFKAVIFHQRFEAIHPFEDGNGRTGRLLLLWMLSRAGYDVILFKNKNRHAYFSALSKADDGQERTWLRHAISVYCNTIAELHSIE